MMRVVIVGINPGNSAGARNTTLRRLPLWTEVIGLREYAFTNCILVRGRYKYSDVDGDALLERVRPYDKVIALGNFPSEVLRRLGVPHFRLPHPSGLNRQLNDPEYEAARLYECRRYICDA